jgi:meiotically up-regulated gene 157 (Mug157) protein
LGRLPPVGRSGRNTVSTFRKTRWPSSRCATSCEFALDGYGDATRVANQAVALGAASKSASSGTGATLTMRASRWMYAYETDGYGRYNLMDDANIPNLTTLPYIDWCSAFDPTYLATRGLR